MILALLLAPYGCGKTRNCQFFQRMLPSPSVRLSVDAEVFKNQTYRQALQKYRAGKTNRNILRTTYLKLVSRAQEQYDNKLTRAFRVGSSMILEESGRNPRWLPWFQKNTLKEARNKGYRVHLFYLVTNEEKAYRRCVWREGPLIPRSDFNRCRTTALTALHDLAPHVDKTFVYSTEVPGPPHLLGEINDALGVDSRVVYDRLLKVEQEHLLEVCPRGAWVTLVMGGVRYVPGALALAQSLRQVGTRFDIVCMVTADVPVYERNRLKKVFHQVLEVPVLSCSQVRPMRGKKQRNLYPDSFVTTIFTKWNALTLSQYDKVACVDADIIFRRNSDELFFLTTPAGTFVNPWSPDSRYGLLEHGDEIGPDAIRRAYRDPHGFVVFGSLVLLQPEEKAFDRVRETLELHSEPYGTNFKCSNGPDELLITEIYVPRSNQTMPYANWVHIDPRYHLIPWKVYEPPVGAAGNVGQASGLHYFGGEKPWEMQRQEWPDLEYWWGIWDTLPDDVKQGGPKKR